MAGKLFNYPLKLTTQYKGLPHWLLKTQNLNVLQNMSHTECQIKPANYLPIISVRNITVPDFKKLSYFDVV